MNNTLSQNIIKEWGLDNMSPEQREDAVDRIGKMLYQAVLVRSLDILSEKEQTDMDSLLDKEGSTIEDVLGFLASKIPTFDTLIAEERAKLKADLLLTQ
jgi:hypothetical protein